MVGDGRPGDRKRSEHEYDLDGQAGGINPAPEPRGRGGATVRQGTTSMDEESGKAELPHHGQLIPLFPPFDDPAIFNAVENQSVDVHTAARRGYIAE